MSLGQIVKGTRLRAGISQRSLARRAGTTQASISRIENGLEEPGWERFSAIMASMGWAADLSLRPIASHRAEPRRLLEERQRQPADRMNEAMSAGRLARRIRAGADVS